MKDPATQVSRRGLMKNLIATDRPKRYAMVIDTRRCIGCQACTVACKSENDVPLGESRSWVETIEKGNFPDVGRSFLPRLCNQCEKPGCVSVCPTGATYTRKEDGVVAINKEICIGCKYCILACPYGVRYLDPKTGSVDKCDFCLHRIEKGVVPACVNTCQGAARIFGDINDPSSAAAKMLETNSVSVLRHEMGTEPMVFYIGADHSDERYAERTGVYVRVETHRRQQKRV